MNKMNFSQWLNILLILAIVAIVVILMPGKETPTHSNQGQEARKSAMVLDNIFQRKSVRKYVSGKEISKQDLTQLMKAGMAAPTARNVQPWEFIAVIDPKLKEALAAELPYAKMLIQSSAAIIVCGNTHRFLEGEGREYWVQDCSAATQNILLAAEAMGLGAVWTGVYPVKARVESVSRVLGLGDSLIPLCVIPMGYPVGGEQARDKYIPERIHFK